MSAQQPSWSLTGAPFSAGADEIQKAAAQVAPEKFTEVTLFLERTSYSFDTEGRRTFRHTLLYRIESKEGVRDWAEISAHWEPWHQDKPELKARVIQPDGKTTELDQKTVTESAIASNSNQDETYTDARRVKAPLPALAVGTIVEEDVQIKDREPYFSGGGIYWDSFSRRVPTLHSELIVDLPAATNFRYSSYKLPDAKISNTVTGGQRHFEVIQNYLPANTYSDIPLYTSSYTGPVVQFSTGESWAGVAAAYAKLAEPNIVPESVTSFLPAPLSSNRRAAIEQLVIALHKEIRYTGIEFGQAALQPQKPEEVFKRHYGDCKDKAALLVSMLRAAKIPAYLALLDTGPGDDVSDDLPGMNFFNHAIVYVPDSDAKGHALWIDATAEYAELGTLPYMDRNRLALIVEPKAKGLTRTPAATPEENALVEEREIRMAEYGPAHIAETTHSHGDIDDEYRSSLGVNETKQSKTNLENYAKSMYMAKELNNFEHSDGKDISKPFWMKLTINEGRRGNTLIEDAAVAIPFAALMGRLPQWFKVDPKQNSGKLTAEQEEDKKKQEAARAPSYQLEPFYSEWNYTIYPPDGFELRALPEEKKVSMGPAVFSEHFEQTHEGVIKAKLYFTTTKAEYTSEELLALRDGVVAAFKQDMAILYFDQRATKLINAGKTREALAVDSKLIQEHPSEAIHHAQYAYVLNQAGMGALAKAEAKKSTELDAKSPVNWRTLGWVCQFNEIGIHFGQGFDLDCSIDSYNKALALDEDDTATLINLGLINEYNARGARYAQGSHLKDAIKAYRQLAEKDKASGEEYEDNLLYALLYNRSYKEFLEEVDKLPSSKARNALGIAAVVAQAAETATPLARDGSTKDVGVKGVSEGIKRADHLNTGAEERSAALAGAGSALERLGLYSQASEILQASAEGQSNAGTITQQVEIYRHLKRWNGEYLPETDPANVVQKFTIQTMLGTLTEKNIEQLLAREAYAGPIEWKRNYDKNALAAGMLRILAEQNESSEEVLFDTIVGNTSLTSEGSDKTGYSVTFQMLGADPQHFFVVKEKDGYRIVTDGNNLAEAGNEAIYLLNNGRKDEARNLLDWTRDKLHKGGGDDPYSGPLLPLFWTVGDEATDAQARIAAASLLAYDSGILPLIPELRKAWENETREEEKRNLALLLAEAYFFAEDGANLKLVAAELLKKHSGSVTAIRLAGFGEGLQNNWPAFGALIETQLTKRPNDDELLNLKLYYANEIGDYALAHKVLERLVKIGKVDASNYNSIAWSALFEDKISDEAIEAGQQANMMTHNNNFSILHTLACLYAAKGQTAEARDTILKAMNADNISAPNAAAWYVFGLIYEQYGINDAAIQAFKQVEKPIGRIDPIDTYVLAQRRLKALEAKKN